MNPYAFINLYKSGYNLKVASVTSHGKAAYEVRLIAQNKSNDLQLIILTIEKATNLPFSIRMKNSHGDWTRIRVSNIRIKRHWSDSTFKFDKQKHPNIEVVDLR